MKLTLILSLLLGKIVVSQTNKPYSVRCVAFYNVENLFDIYNDSLVFDDERTPNGAYEWTSNRYHRKIANISKVLSAIGSGITKTSPDIIGLCEIENRSVLNDLVNHPNLRDQAYGIIHMDSPDERGIDVALLYKKAVFLPVAFQSRRLLLFDEEGYRDYTRDQLVVSGVFEDEPWYFIVNHWPSRSGGALRSRPNRIAAARLNKRIIDSLLHIRPDARIISMGDFNDDPRDISIKKVLRTQGSSMQLDSVYLVNAMESLYRKGQGTLAYRDKWNLFDQFLITPHVISNREHYFFWKARIFAPDYLKTATGPYKGYPFRTFVGTTYQGGYADHFPVYLLLLKPTD
ncbi:MAG: endonuclease/exonuclease/phosphatase family protein [Bacteroidota bacterium]